LEVTRLTRLARRGLPRSTVGTGLEAGIAQPVPAALGHHQSLARLDQVADHFLSGHVDDRGAHRYRQDQVFTLGPGAIGAAALLTVLRQEFARIAVVDQGVEVLAGFEEHRATVTPIAAVGAALLDELLAAEAHHAVTAVTGFYKN